jgi:hypothetical protein
MSRPGPARQAIEQALVAAGKDLDHLQPADLALLEDFHTMGRIATARLADLVQATPDDEVLDAVRAGFDLVDRAAAGLVACFPRGAGPGCPPGRRRPASRR